MTNSFVSNSLNLLGNFFTEIFDHERFLNEEGGPKSDSAVVNGGNNAAFASVDSSSTSIATSNGTTARPMAFGPMKPATGRQNAFDVWVKGVYTEFDDSTANAGHDGGMETFLAGAHYNVSDTLLIGALFSLDNSDWDSSDLTTAIDSDGWLAGAYLRKRFSGESALSLTATWGGSDNDIRVVGRTGSFDADRFLIIGNYWNTWRNGPRRISGNVGLIYAEEDSDGYTLSDGTIVTAQSAELGRLFFGPEFGYKVQGPGMRVIEPLIWLRGIWDFESEGRINVSSIASIDREEFYGQIGGGVHLALTETISSRVTVQYDGIGAGDYDAWSIQGRLNIPLN